ncbi:MAG: ATP-binding domain-containing protein [Calothrix sp. SM1_7_51]|nr:ATP-binding domain-containing protein [Calothrix sp. SM1_7_51]
MAIQAYRTQPYTTTHENRIFDALLGRLEEVWGHSEDIVLLLGNFHCQGSEIDAAILKKDSITVIDFKDYEGIIKFSENGKWLADAVEIRGGNKPNPYIQIRDNKFALIKILEKISFPSGNQPNLGHISGLVLFHKSITFEDSQLPPNIERWFHIVDFDRAIERLSQITSRGISLANQDLDYIAKTLSIPEYKPVRAGAKAVSFSAKVVGTDSRELPISFQSVTSKVENFLESSERILIISGMIGTGLEQLIDAIASKALEKSRYYSVLAPNRRLASHYLVEADSIYTHIYSRNPKLDNEKFIYALTDNKDIRRQLYIIGDAQLISDSKFETDNLRYGSGQILTDLLSFINLKESERQIIFLGDPFQITRGKADESVLCNERLHSVTGFQVSEVVLKYISPEKENDLFVHNCLKLAERINKKIFNQMDIATDGIKIIESPSEQASKHQLIQDLFLKDSISTKFIAFSNSEVNQFNNWLRRNIFNRSGSINSGDIVHIHNSFSLQNTDDYEPPIYVSNDSFAEVIEVNENVEPLVQFLKGRETPITVPFLRIKVRLLKDLKEIEFFCFKSYLYTDKPELDKDTLLALHVSTKAKFDRDWKNSNSGNAEESDYNLELSKFLRNDPYFNAARLRFGYALTLHRAQGQQFKSVFVNMDIEQGKTSESYFRWVYTLLSIPQERIILSNIPKITPFYKVIWDSTQGRLDSVRPINLIAFDPNIEVDDGSILEFSIPDKPLKNLYLCIVDSIKSEGINVCSYKHHNYQEVYDFKDRRNRSSCSLRLHYNRKYQITKIESIRSEPIEFASVVRDLITSSNILETDFQKQVYNLLKKKLNANKILIESIEHHNFQEIYYLKLEGENLKLRINYDGDGFITRITPLGYTSIKIVEIVRLALEL